MAVLEDMLLTRRIPRWRSLAWQDVAIVCGFFLLALIFFWPVTVGGKTLLPLDNLYLSEPWQSQAAVMGVTTPHNGLLSDLVLENYVWKRFIVESLRARRVPLWNPYLFAGVPFLAAGQHSALYPLSLVYYILPLPQAFGWFTMLQFFLTAVFTYAYGRILGMNRFGAFIAGLTYTFSLFMVAQVVFPMIIAALAWLPLLLAAIELIVRARAERADGSPLPGLVLGVLALGCEWLAGHGEITYFTLIVMALYTLWRLISVGWQTGRARGARPALARVGSAAGWLLLMVALGFCLGAIQIVPLLELVRVNFRQGSVTLQDVIGWAYPIRRLLAFVMPDFFGNPSHHAYWDVFSRTIVPATRNYAGQPITTIDWGIKNYVEGASYVGILPLFLALIGIVGRGWGQRNAAELTIARQRTYVWFFVALALFSLLLAFGTPLYAVIFTLPVLSQSHSPFRWIFPYVFSVSTLAGIGATYLGEQLSSGARRWTARLSGLAAAAGMLALAALAAGLVFPARAIPLAEQVMLRLTKAPEAFADGRMFFSYQFRNVAILSGLLVGSGLVLWLASREWGWRRGARGVRVWQPLAALLLMADLYVLGSGFNPAVDPALLDVRLPVVEFLQSDAELYRIATFDTRDAKPFPANVGMYFDIQDIAGYDSIIPRQYTQFMRLIEDQGELLYNRIARLRHPESLDSPLLDLLNVKYVLTEETVTRPGYTLVYDGELRVYRNDDYMPRAFVVREAQVVADESQLYDALRTFDPRRTAVVEEAAPPLGAAPVVGTDRVEIAAYTPNEVVIAATLPTTGMLVLADSHFGDWLGLFNGWKAFVTPEGAAEEEELHIYRVDGNFRGVVLTAGSHIVRFRYSPMSVKFGLFGSFFGAMVLLLIVGVGVWGRYYKEDAGDHVVRRVVKNTAAPITLTLVNRGMDMAFAMFMLRVLGPVNAGKYTFAVVVVTWFEILTNFGLNTLLTREVARDRAHANRYLVNSTILRLAFGLLAVPLALAFSGFWGAAFELASDTRLAILLFTIGLIPSGISTGLTAVFNAYEKMEYPAAISVLTTILRIIGGTLALLLGFGFVGLAAVSILVSSITLLVLCVAVVQQFFRPRLELDFALQRRMLSESYPLMINHLLATLFIKVNVTLLQAMKGDQVVGYVGTAYKPVDALTIIPSYFTMALFPLMSRYAISARDSLRRAYLVSLRLLLWVSLPLMVTFIFAAEPLIALLGGAKYLPESRIALQLMIGFLPFSFVNGVTQYVLIALDQQRFLTRAFAFALAFNLVANILLIPAYSYRASAVIMIFSEIALLLPFYYCIRRHLGSVPWFSLAWRPALGAAAMALILLALRSHSLILTLPLALVAYAAILLVTGGVTAEDRALIREARSHTAP